MSATEDAELFVFEDSATLRRKWPKVYRFAYPTGKHVVIFDIDTSGQWAAQDAVSYIRRDNRSTENCIRELCAEPLNLRRISRLSPGHYYPRIWRPSIPRHPQPASDDEFEHRKLVTGAVASAQLLMNTLKNIFATVEPIPDNMSVYGHRIRQLLLLACMEVEAHWTGVLRANKYSGSRWTTKDYVKLCDPLNLTSFCVTFPMYPALLYSYPFSGWKSESPTVSLPWYDAYNKTKHDREAHFAQASLGHAVSAVAGVTAMLAAQFGGKALTSTSHEVASYALGACPSNPRVRGYGWNRTGT